MDAVQERSSAATATTPYQQWQKAEGIPIVHGSYVADPFHLDLGPWARIGQRGAFVNLADQEMDDAWIVEIGPGGQTEELHHVFEAGIYVLEGRGASSFWAPGKAKQTVEWQSGSLFAPPLNCHYQHFNLDGQRPARLFCVTNAPMVINLFRDGEFAFNEPYAFTDRYNGEEDYFADHGVPADADLHLWKTNFVPDIRSFRLDQYRVQGQRGADSVSLAFHLSNNSMFASNVLFAVGSYKKGHRHGPGAHLLILEGQGYSLLWKEGDERNRVKVDWREGTIISPKESEYHQHCNTGPTPAMYFKFRLAGLDITRADAGFAPTNVEYEDEDPAIYDQFERECAKNGVTVAMDHPRRMRA